MVTTRETSAPEAVVLAAPPPHESSSTTNEVATVKDYEEELPPSESPHSHQPSPKKKRRSDVQLNKEDGGDGTSGDEGDDDDDLNDNGGKLSDPFQRASEDVLSRRKILSPSCKWSPPGGRGGDNGRSTTAGGELFASVKLAVGSSRDNQSSADDQGEGAEIAAVGSGFGSVVANGGGGFFGSGFGSATSGGFGALKKTSSDGAAVESNDGNATKQLASSVKSTAFGGGFSASSFGFGTLKSSSSSAPFGFGSATASTPLAIPWRRTEAAVGVGGSLGGIFVKIPATSSSDATSAQSKLPNTTANGEQDENCLCQVRARLFKMVYEDESASTTEIDVVLPRDDVPSVPSTRRSLDFVKERKEEKGRGGSVDDDDANETKESMSGSKNGREEGAEKGRREGVSRLKLVQKEAGIGPVRILKLKPRIVPLGGGRGGERNVANNAEQKTTTSGVRIVQRQETSGGGAFRVILNVRLEPKSCTFHRRGDKFVQLNALNNVGVIESFLFKVKTVADADTLEGILRDVLEV